ncbi:cyclohexanecarboxylate-CoA ligase [Reticulibacter mediterranei]|uniref:Cyclohexanecarboxylate-CoA ligase n=2 Tax=Reticulibacter mediterranei TaxID=2778369 RepID=A0A8J3N3P6_9CHLR|nr:cyclohexanecarboxylate-CoA ligase [Reticulibacter mediterranei]
MTKIQPHAITVYKYRIFTTIVRRTTMITTQDYFIHPEERAASLKGYTLPAIFNEAVTTGGEGPAVFDGTRLRSWHDWSHDAFALARVLQELGVSKGDVVALHLPNSWEYLTLHVAIALTGAIMFPLHMAYGELELRVLLERASASILVLPASHGQRDLLTLGERLLTTLPSLQHLFVTNSQAHSGIGTIEALLQQYAGASPQPVSLSPTDPFVLLPSSGTTSLRPKICIHSHDGLLSNAAAVASDGNARAEDTIISASPFTHLFGLLSIHLSILSHGRQALLPGWGTERFFELAHQSKATVAFAVPAQLRDVCLHLDTQPETPRLHLREVRTGGAKVPSSLVADIRRTLGAGVIVQWGMSEVGAGTFTRPDDPPEAASTSIGRPVTGAEVRIVNENMHDITNGETGNLLYRSPSMFCGYLKDERLTREAITTDGWLRTGDLASFNTDGTVAFEGRRTELINRGGLKFSAVEVESLLVDLVQLNQLAIIARPDERLGERSCLVASLRSGYSITLAEITTHLAAKGLAKYKWPEELLLLNELPATPTGKIARVRLMDLLQVEDQK